MNVKMEYEDPLIIRDNAIFVNYPIALFNTFEDLYEFLECVEINENHKISVTRTLFDNKLTNIQIEKR